MPSSERELSSGRTITLAGIIGSQIVLALAYDGVDTEYMSIKTKSDLGHHFMLAKDIPGYRVGVCSPSKYHFLGRPSRENVLRKNLGEIRLFSFFTILIP